MNKDHYNLWNKITFRTVNYRKNFDLINENESFISEYSGLISEIRLSDNLPPVIVGEYGYSVWNIEFALKFGSDITTLLKHYKAENIYNELLDLVTEEKINVFNYKKIILIHNLVVHPKYRKLFITEEFVESIYREYSDDNVAIIALVMPIQYNEIDNEYFYKHNKVKIHNSFINQDDYTIIKASDYYSLDDLLEKTDVETNEYKLYALAAKCGFNRIDESHLFLFKPEKITNRINEKLKYTKSIKV